MRISDWSSDVCSSDLARLARLARGRQPVAAERRGVPGGGRRRQADRRDLRQGGGKRPGCEAARAVRTVDPGRGRVRALQGRVRRQARRGRARSEEHTSELQSLMRISYAVFCLKNKTNRSHTKRQKKASDI